MKKILVVIAALVLTLQSAQASIDPKTGGSAMTKDGQLKNSIGDASELKVPKQVHAAHILVDNKALADELKKKIDNGTSFEKLAEKYSTCPSGKSGGDLGFFSKGQMVKPFEDAAFNLPEGKVSEPVKTQFGWHLIKVYERKY